MNNCNNLFPTKTNDNLYNFTSFLTHLDELHSDVEKTNQDIIKLSKKISDLKTDKKSILNKIFTLEGGSKSRLIIIGKLIKIFFICWNWSNWNNVRKQYQIKCDKLKTRIEDLKNKSRDKNNLDVEVKSLNNRPLSMPTITKDLVPAIFKFESQWRDLLNPNPRTVSDPFSLELRRIVQMTKKFLQDRLELMAFKAAALRGQAVGALFSSVEQSVVNNPIVYNHKLSANQVILLPEAGAVIKKGYRRGVEEERLVNCLFDFYAPNGVVSSHTCQEASSKNLNLTCYDYGINQRKVDIQSLKSNFQLAHAIKGRLTTHRDQMIFDALAHTLSNEEKLRTQRAKRKQYFLKRPGDHHYEEITFNELKYLFLEKGSLIEGKIICLEDKIRKEIDLENDTELLSTLKIFSLNSDTSLCCIPDLNDPTDLKAYENCERSMWSCKNEAGEELVLNFSTLHRLYLVENLRDIKPKMPINGSDYQKALRVNWRIISDDLLYLQSLGTISTLSKFQIKPFVENLLTFKYLAQYPKAYQKILQRLTSEDVYRCVLTGIFQCLDLHDENLGVAPMANDEWEKYKHLTFHIRSIKTDLSLMELSLSYLQETINSKTVVEFQLDGYLFKEKIVNLPSLMTALNSPWKLMLYDTDWSLAESNYLQIFKNPQAQYERNVPIRSALFETSWRDQPLQEETIDRILKSEANDQQVFDWMQRLDAPIWKKLSKEVKEQVRAFIEPIIQKYNLSDYRIIDTHFTIEQLNRLFVKEIISLHNAEGIGFWQLIEDNLKIPLTYINADAARAKIAKQFFPRMTINQQTALKDRLHHLRSYLRNYHSIRNSPKEGDDLITEMLNYVGDLKTPLPTFERVNFLKSINHLHNLPPEIKLSEAKRIFPIILKCVVPTFFSCMKAMYPLLADANLVYSMSSLHMKYSTSYTDLPSYDCFEGTAFGHYRAPLEEAITYAKQNYFKDTIEYQIADDFENRLRHVTDCCFSLNLAPD